MFHILPYLYVSLNTNKMTNLNQQKIKSFNEWKQDRQKEETQKAVFLLCFIAIVFFIAILTA